MKDIVVSAFFERWNVSIYTRAHILNVNLFERIRGRSIRVSLTSVL